MQADQTVLSAPARDAALGSSDQGGQRRVAGRGAGGGQHRRHAQRQARTSTSRGVFPVVWVELHDTPSRSRPAGLRAGLTMYVLEGGGFRTVPSRRAFPGSMTKEIQFSLDEPELLDPTTAARRRVAQALGAAEGAGRSVPARRAPGGPAGDAARSGVAGVQDAGSGRIGCAAPACGQFAGPLHRSAGASGVGVPRRG